MVLYRVLVYSYDFALMRSLWYTECFSNHAFEKKIMFSIFIVHYLKYICMH